jgi:7-cyano-7-deazaguanine synthase
MPKAVVLLSGGMDSATVLALARRKGFACHALTVDYGQRHRVEIAAARTIARLLGVRVHKVISLDLRWIGGSALTSNTPVPKGRNTIAGIPVTYVPARNTILLGLALGWAEVLGAHDIFIGVNAIDYSGYPDCRPAFISAFSRMARLATRSGVEGGRVRIHTPLIRRSKADIVRTGTRLGVDFRRTTSCYDPDRRGRACGRCAACRIRRKGFADAGIQDMTVYHQQS